ncbi:unnamed protein product [Pieris brassicae]|uniref:Uncharacterized protein n=1 Tax=Pieris brassicae TaxID=7116 RepID=A0A9P0XFY2_PIEBR|nr:unnamed protein product [Pieris brassicae]
MESAVKLSNKIGINLWMSLTYRDLPIVICFTLPTAKIVGESCSTRLKLGSRDPKVTPRSLRSIEEKSDLLDELGFTNHKNIFEASTVFPGRKTARIYLGTGFAYVVSRSPRHSTAAAGDTRLPPPCLTPCLNLPPTTPVPRMLQL